MKRFVLYMAAVAIVLVAFSSCAATKRDCNGVKHYKQKGGFYL